MCGRRLSIQHSKGRYTYFFCLGQKNDPAGTCRERYIAADDLEAQVEQLDAYYSGAIDVPTLKTEQARIGTDLAAAQDRLADLDANLTEWQEILELAAAFATRCGDAYRKASDPTRKHFNAAVFTRIDVKDGRVCHEEYRPPFDDIFNMPEFEYAIRERTTGFEPATLTLARWSTLFSFSQRIGYLQALKVPRRATNVRYPIL